MTMAAPITKISGLIPALCRTFSVCCRIRQPQKSLASVIPVRNYSIATLRPVHSKRPVLQTYSPLVQTVRTRMHWDWLTIKCNKTEGKPESNQDVLKRFKRLNSGLWIRTRAGRKRRLWTKYSQQKYRLRQHVFCNTQQSNLLDKMVTKEWKKKTYFVDDPYEPYQKRTGMEKLGLDIKKPRFIP